MTSPGANGQHVELAAQTNIHDLSGLARAAQCGGQAETEDLLQRVHVIAHRYSKARLGSYPGGSQLADDVAQEICIAVLGALPRYRDRGRPFEAFVHGVASRKVADAQRAAAKRPLPTDEVPDEVDAGPTPEECAVLASEVETANGLLARLPENLREVMLLRVAAGLSAEEVGAALDMSPGAVRVAQHRALAKMRSYAGQLHEVAHE